MRGLAMILLAAVATTVPSTPVNAADDGPAAIPAEEVDRELIVRFSRAYGMARGAVDRHEDVGDDADLQNPERFESDLRDEIYEIMDLNGVSRDEWQGLLARMEQDQALRDRIESLSTPFRYQ